MGIVVELWRGACLKQVFSLAHAEGGTDPAVQTLPLCVGAISFTVYMCTALGIVAPQQSASPSRLQFCMDLPRFKPASGYCSTMCIVYPICNLVYSEVGDDHPDQATQQSR